MAIKIQGTTILDDNRNLLSGNTITAASFVGPLAGNANTVTNGVYTIGDQSIGGVKTFTGIPAFNGGVSGTSAPFTVDSTTVVTNLNADLLDGQNLVNNASTVNTVAGRDGSGDIYARLLRTTYTEDSGITSTAGVHMRVNANTDNYSRIVTGTGFVNWLENYDGAGSGLDADLLDGVQGTSYLRSDVNDTASGLISFDRGAATYTDAFVLQSGTVASGNPGLFFKKADSNTVHLTMWNGSAVQGKLFINSPTTEINSTTSVFGDDGTNGYLQLNRGNTTNPGYISFHTPDNVRRSYIGWNNSNQNALVAENGWGWSVTGNVNFDSATMFVDATNNRVGMGTPNPKENLHVNGELALSHNNFLSSNLYFDGNWRFIGSSGYAGFMKLASGANDLEISVSNASSAAADSIAGIHRAAAYEMDNKNWLFYTDNVEKMRITGSGNIGIGTVNPSSTAGVDGRAIHINTDGLVGELRFTNSTSGTTVTDGAYLQYDGAALSLYNMENGYLRFGTNNQERMRIVGADGNVGIGVSVPSEKLHVEGTTRSISFASANGSASSPAYDFAADTNTGMFLLGPDTIGFATNGSPAGAFTSAGDLRLYNTAGNRFITISNQPTANVTITVPVLTTNSNFVLSEGTATVNGAKTFSDLRISGPLTNTGADSRDKLRVWSSSSYSIGMTRMNYGSLGFANGSVDYAMTFQMNNVTSRGFWWGDDAHANSQGAMALSTDGKLVVATAIRVGFGESDIVVPSTTPALDVNGSVEYVYNDNGAGTLGQEGIRLISPDSASSRFLPQILAHNKNNGLQGGPYWNSRKTNGETGAATTGQALGTFNFQSTDTGGTVRNAAAFAAVSAGAGASNHTAYFAFKTTSTGDSDPVDRMTLTSAGYLGVGTTAPTTTIHAVKSTTVGNTIDYPLIVDRITTGNPGIGMGSGIQLAVRTSPAAASIVAATIEAVATDITSGAEDFALVFKTGVSGSGANTTAEAMKINAGNRILLGGTVQYGSTGEIPKLQLSGSFNRETRIGFFHWQSSVNAGSLEFNKSRSSTEGVYTAVNNNDNLGVLLFKGADGNTFIQAASLRVEVDGTPTTNYVPGRLVFETSDAGGLPGGTTEKFRINNTGALGFGGANFGIEGDVLTSTGSGDVPSWGGAEYTQVMTDIKTLTSTTASQAIFPATSDTITLPVGTYEYEMVLHLSGMSATSGNALINILGAGTATISSALSQAVGVDTTTISTPGAAQYSAWTGTSSAASVLTAGTGTAMTVFINGVFRVSVAGTIIPSLSLVTAAAATVNVNTHMHVRRIYKTAGASTFGPWS